MYQLLMLPISLLAQAALACMRGLRRLRLIRCRFQDPQMPGLPKILAKAPSLTVHIGRLLHLYNGCASTHQFAPKSCCRHGSRPHACAACGPAVPIAIA